ncbi:MAG TPA: hypothetical protein PLO92_02815 [Anaerolineaceae bacterium]|jgi:hypothetical protein|nr:hypothetical protein [Anaerolineaceae bacterium]HQC20747.1 hypothetical protein [Anaerolineaceae bacterium]
MKLTTHGTQRVGWRILVVGILLAVMLNAIPTGTVSASLTSYEIFSLQIHLPEGARIEYLRLYYYDSNPSMDSIAWITTYDGAGNFSDLINVSSFGSAGYGQALSAYFAHVVDNEAATYVLNWRPRVFDSSMRLMGMRVAYRLPDGAGGWAANYSYLHVAGCTFTPVSSQVEWRYPGGGGVYATSWDHFLPFLRK